MANLTNDKSRKRKAAAFGDIFHYDNQLDFKFGNSFNPSTDAKTSSFDDSSSSEDEDFQALSGKQWKKNDESVDLSDEESSSDGNEEDKEDCQSFNSQNLSPSPPPPPPLDTPTLARETSRIRASKQTREVESTLDFLKKASEMQSPSPPALNFTSPTTREELIIVDDSPSSYEPVISENRNMVVKVRTRSGVQRLNMKSGEPFRTIIPEIARKENIPEEKILLTLWGEVLDVSDTPFSLGVTVADILECIVAQNDDILTGEKMDEEEGIEVKIQGGNSKQIKTFKIRMTEPLENIMVKYCSIMGLQRQKVHFSFDGDEINSTDTPEDLDMEDGNVIDVKVK